jgi:hypothetical protein
LLVPFTEFPWFREATIDQLLNVQRPTPDHLYWPQLDVDPPSHPCATRPHSRWSLEFVV